ncbi:MAG: DHH family phosphoesterase [Coprobacillus sp.]|nr:DHH family phosphoesterase [Coprobacillus sp.]
MDSFYFRLLSYYGISEADYKALTKEVSLADISSYEIKGMAMGATHLLSLLDKKIMVYGDYDADGIISTSIMVKTFMMLNKKVGYYIPSRYIDGYGISLERARQIVEKGYEVVILVDNGLSALEEVNYLKEHGVTIYILDHHEKGEELPKADYIYVPREGVGETPLSASELTLIFSSYLLGKYDMYLVTLASISVISDMMPLVGFNRNLVRLATKSYKDGTYLALDLLKEDEDFTSESIAMKIAPKINAVGRINKDNTINRLVKLLTSEDGWEIKNLAQWLNKVNSERKEMSDKIDDYLNSHSREEGVISLPILEGLSGIAANNALRRYKRPVIVLCDSDKSKNELKGSIRAPEGYDVIEILDSLKDYLLVYGGHKLAGGLTIARDKISAFTEDFNKHVSHYKVHKEIEKSLTMNITEIILDNYYLIYKLGPFGEKWESPLLKIPSVRPKTFTFSRDEKHIITSLSMESRIVGFNISKEEINKHSAVDLYGEMRLNDYRGVNYVEFLIRKYSPVYK